MRRRRSLYFFAGLGLGVVSAAGAEVTGILRDNLGHGLSNLTVTATYYDSVSGSTQAVATTDVAGHFNFSGITNTGYWSIEVPAAELNARGYLGVSSQYRDRLDRLGFDRFGDGPMRFTTRKLDFTHRVAGRLADETGLPLAGYRFRASITENNALFETNVVADANGSFLLHATPAVWTFGGLEPPEGTTSLTVFGERSVEIEVTNVEKQLTITAPIATSTIVVTASNLAGWDIAVDTEAFGQSYSLLKHVSSWDPVPLTFDVFNGAWRVSATNSCANCVYPSLTLPPPILVSVTNQAASVGMAGISTPGPKVYRQRLRFVTAGGTVVTNAGWSASSRTDPYYSVHPYLVSPQPSGNTNLPPPGAVDLPLPEGRWIIKASTGTDVFFGMPIGGWTVSRDVDITTNSPLPEITFVFPEPAVGPRLHGTLSDFTGSPPDSGVVSLYMTINGTNYNRSLSIDALGQFGTNVPPGRWLVQTYVNCPLSSVAVVSNQDVEVNLEYTIPVPGAPIPVSLSVVDDRGEPTPDARVTLRGFDYQNLLADPLLAHLLPPAVWTASLGDSTFSGLTPSFRLNPSFRWQLSPGAPPTSLVLVPRHATSRIEGRLRDEQGRLMLSGYAAAWTSVNGTNFQTYGPIASGYFSLNVFPGEWQVGADISSYPAVGAYTIPGAARSGPIQNRYTSPATRLVRVTNDVVRCEFVTTNIPNLVALTVTVAREDGGPVDGLYISISTDGPVTGEYKFTDRNGTAAFLTTPGAHQISAYPGVYDVTIDPLLWPMLSAEVTAPSNHVLLIVRQPSTCIPGTLSNAPSLGLQPHVLANAKIHGTNYSITLCPDTDGNFCVPAIPGPWTVGIESSTLPGNGIQTVAPREVTVPQAGATPRADFTLTPIVGDFRTASLSRPVLLSDGRLRLDLEGQAALTWRIERSENLRDWTLVAIQSMADRSLVIEEPTEPSRRAAFYRAVWVR